MMSGPLPPLSSRTSGGVSPTCCCSVSLDCCNRCDLLVELEGLHLVAIAWREVLVLDIESCDRCAGCRLWADLLKDTGVVVEVIDAPWLGYRRVSGGINDAGCAANTCQTVTFLERSEKVCAPRAHRWGSGRSAERSDSCASREHYLRGRPAS